MTVNLKDNANQQDKVAPLWEGVFHAKLVKDCAENVSTLFVFLHLRLKEMSPLHLLEASGDCLLERGVGAEDNSRTCSESWCDERLGADQPPNAPASRCE